MTLRQLGNAQWQTYFDRVAAALGAKQVEIEVAGLGLGDQVEADWIPLIGLSYDPAGDSVAVIGEGVEHFIRHPKHIHVEHDTESLRSVEVIDAEDVHHFVLLRDPLSLPAP